MKALKIISGEIGPIISNSALEEETLEHEYVKNYRTRDEFRREKSMTSIFDKFENKLIFL